MTTYFCKPHHSTSSRHQGQGHMVKMQQQQQPQVNLTMPTHGVPIFEAPPPRHHHQHSTSNTFSFSWPGQMLSRVTNMFRSPQTVQWVNRHLVNDDDLHHYNTAIMGPVSFHSPEEGPLWHAAPPGGINQQMVMTDPQNILSHSLLPRKQDNMNTNPTFHKSTKTLNPNAQEWVPKEYMTTTITTTTTTTSTTYTNGYILSTSPNTSTTVVPIPFTATTQSPVITATTNTKLGESPIHESTCTSESPQNHKITSPPFSSSLESQNMSSQSRQNTLGNEQFCFVDELTYPSHPNIADDITFSPENLQSSLERQMLITDTCDGSKYTMKQIPERLLSPKNVSENQEFTLSSLRNPKNTPENKKQNLENMHQNSDITGESFEFIPNCLTRQEIMSESKKQNLKSMQQNHHDTKTKNIITNNNNNNNDKVINPESFQGDKNATKINKQNSKEISISQDESLKSKMPECQVIASSPSPIRSLSYAGALGRMSPPPPPPPQQPLEVKYKGTQQPLPKIFQRDKPLQKGEFTDLKEEGRRTCNLFRKPNKTQRTQSRKFLKELKADASCSSSTCPSTNSFVPSSLSPSKVTVISPETIPIPNICHSSYSPSSSDYDSSYLITSSPSTSQLNLMSPQITPKSPVAIPTTPPSPIMPLSPTHETPHQVRSSSESSSASLDIEFVEKDEVDRALQVSPTSSKPIQPPKGIRNSILACILGSVDSEAEEEESSDDESDWDEVCEDSKTDIDDSWETFGFGLVLVAHPVLTMPNQQCQGQYKEPDYEEKDDAFRDINERWDEGVKKDVRGKSEPRVKFGSVKVHPMVVWDHAYRQARHGPWEQQARDRVRFAERIENMEPILSKILDPEHRQRVYDNLNNDCIL